MDNLQRLRTSAVSVQDSIQARQDLEWIADRWWDLHARLIPMSTPNSGSSRRTPSSRPPLNLHISNLLWEIEYETRMLGHTLLQETHNWRPRSSAMPQLLRDVAEMAGHWCVQEDAVAVPFVEWATTTRTHTTRALENPPHPQYVGPCQHCPPGQGDLYLKHRSRQATCRNCRASIDIDTQMGYVQQHLENRLMTLTEIRAALTILNHPRPIGTLKTWTHNGRLLAEPGGLYRLADALDLARNTPTRTRTNP